MTLGVAGEDGVGDNTSVHAETCECLASALAVYDDAVEALEQPSPKILLPRRAPRQEVVRGEDRRDMRAEQAHVELRYEPLEMQHIRALSPQRRKPKRMLGHLERQAKAGPLKQPRRERIEELAPDVAVRPRRLAEPKVRRDEHHVYARAREGGGQLVVVRRSERRRICEYDPHLRP